MLNDSTTNTDFIVSELLSELKAENSRKDQQIHRLNKTLIATILAALISIMLVVAGFLWYLNQYDFSATTTENITNSAEGVYAIVDSDGNVISSDLTAEEIEAILKGVTIDGESG